MRVVIIGLGKCAFSMPVNKPLVQVFALDKATNHGLCFWKNIFHTRGERTEIREKKGPSWEFKVERSGAGPELREQRRSGGTERDFKGEWNGWVAGRCMGGEAYAGVGE